MNQLEMAKIVEQFIRNARVADEKINVVRLADSKTVYVETIGDTGRSIVFNEYKVDGKTYWAGYSSRSETVFISEVSQR